MGKTILFSMVCFSFAAFGAEKVHDLAYYKAHPKKAQQVVLDCAADSSPNISLEKSQNCVNAIKATAASADKVNDLAYYKAHPDEAQQVVLDCAADSSPNISLEKSQNCVNAINAVAETKSE